MTENGTTRNSPPLSADGAAAGADAAGAAGGVPEGERPARRGLAGPAYVAFGAFGAYWGVWGASVPRVRDQAGVSDGQLGLALLFVGAGALPAMLLTGRALDRFGLRLAAATIGLLGVVGAAMALTARDLPALCAGLALTGASSGAADVAMNAVAGRAEQQAGTPVIARSHGTFSALVVVAGLATGLAAAERLPLTVPFLVVAAVAVGAAAAMFRAIPRHTPLPAGAGPAPGAGPGSRALLPLLLVGCLGAVAFANENAQQSWSAVFAHDQLHTGTGVAAVAPAVFAATVSAARFGLGSLRAVRPARVLLTGALTAAAGSLTVAHATSVPVAWLGLVLAGGGTAVLFPTLVGVVSRNVTEDRRGRATSVVGTVSYLGFLLGPVYIGAWSQAAGLRGAMTADAALALVLCALTVPLLRLTRYSLAAPAVSAAPDGVKPRR